MQSALAQRRFELELQNGNTLDLHVTAYQAQLLRTLFSECGQQLGWASLTEPSVVG